MTRAAEHGKPGCPGLSARLLPSLLAWLLLAQSQLVDSLYLLGGKHPRDSVSFSVLTQSLQRRELAEPCRAHPNPDPPSSGMRGPVMQARVRLPRLATPHPPVLREKGGRWSLAGPTPPGMYCDSLEINTFPGPNSMAVLLSKSLPAHLPGAACFSVRAARLRP